MGPGIEFAELVRQAVAVIVATRDAELRPEIGRAWAPVLSEDGVRLTVCIEAAPGSTMANNLEPGSPVAATFARLTSHTTVQMKGWVKESGPPTQERRDAVDEHIANLLVEAAEVGVPERLARTLVGTDLLTVTIEIAEAFDDTPGSETRRAT